MDVFIVSHHGQSVSNSPVLVHALRPRVAIMNNGTRKGGQPAAMQVLFSSPGLEDLWQLHFSLLSGQEYIVPGTEWSGRSGGSSRSGGENSCVHSRRDFTVECSPYPTHLTYPTYLTGKSRRQFPAPTYLNSRIAPGLATVRTAVPLSSMVRPSLSVTM